MSTVTIQETRSANAATAFLFFSIGPVQPFIEKAKTVRDLMTGSYLLAWLTSKAIAGLPSLDLLVTPTLGTEKLNPRSPTLPNRFIAQVPADQAETIAQECRRRCLTAWVNLANDVRNDLTAEVSKTLERRLRQSHNLKPPVAGEIVRAVSEWDRLWDLQIGSADMEATADSPFDIHVHVLPFDERQILKIKEVLGDVRCRDRSDWDVHYDLTWALDAARKSTRYVHAYSALPEMPPEESAAAFVPAKCTLFGSYEQMGPAETQASRVFWEWLAGDQDHDGVQIKTGRLRKRERLCAVGLVKRFAWPFLQKAAGHETIAFEDTATVAAAVWLKHAKIDPEAEAKTNDGWSGQWLHWPTRKFDKEETACPDELFKRIQAAKRDPKMPTLPTYYAVMMLDGDKMGDKGRERSGPDAQRELSQLIARFAGKVPDIVQAHFGTLIYAGGDDVLALLPAAKALECAEKLSNEFADLWPTSNFKPATVSAGIAVVHYKQDLRFAINAARKAEKAAKDSGRNAIALSVCRRSGEHATTVMPWEFVSDKIQSWISRFQSGVDGSGSDRWAYALSAELPVLEGLTKIEAISSEIKRLVGRSKASSGGDFVPEDIAQAFVEYFKFRCENLKSQNRQPTDAGFLSKSEEAQDRILLRNSIQGFVTLCRSASFLARGKDQ